MVTWKFTYAYFIITYSTPHCIVITLYFSLCMKIRKTFIISFSWFFWLVMMMTNLNNQVRMIMITVSSTYTGYLVGLPFVSAPLRSWYTYCMSMLMKNTELISQTNSNFWQRKSNYVFFFVIHYSLLKARKFTWFANCSNAFLRFWSTSTLTRHEYNHED